MGFLQWMIFWEKNKWFLRKIFIALLLAFIIKWAFIDINLVLDAEMAGTIDYRDAIILSKIHYGPRTTATPLKIPFTHNTLWGTEIPSYSTLIQTPILRIPGVSEIKRNDVIVFNHPHQLDKPVDSKDTKISRILGLPGDTISIEHGDVYVNHKKINDIGNLSRLHKIKSSSELSNEIIKKNNLIKVDKGRFIANMDDQQLKALNKLDLTIEEVILDSLSPDPGIFPDHLYFPWNRDQFGPIVVPGKNMSINVNEYRLVEYGDVIKYFEGHDEVIIAIDELKIKGKNISKYTFIHDYYFVISDNRPVAEDSRIWGFLPEDHIVGKVIYHF